MKRNPPLQVGRFTPLEKRGEGGLKWARWIESPPLPAGVGRVRGLYEKISLYRWEDLTPSPLEGEGQG